MVADGGAALVAVAVGVLAVAIIVAGSIRHYRLERARLARAHAAARARGWTWVPRDDAVAERFSTRPFGGGDEREAREIVRGHRGRLAFESFRYTVVEHTRDSKGRRRTTRTHWDVVWIPLAASLPAMRLAPDDAFQRVLTGLGWGDVDTESHAFNQRWRVSTRDDAYAHALLAPHVIEELLHPQWAGASVIVEGPALIAARRGLPDPERLDPVLDRLEALAGQIPPFVLADYGR